VTVSTPSRVIVERSPAPLQVGSTRRHLVAVRMLRAMSSTHDVLVEKSFSCEGESHSGEGAFPSGGASPCGARGAGVVNAPPARPANVVTCQSGISMKEFLAP